MVVSCGYVAVAVVMGGLCVWYPSCRGCWEVGDPGELTRLSGAANCCSGVVGVLADGWGRRARALCLSRF